MSRANHLKNEIIHKWDHTTCTFVFQVTNTELWAQVSIIIDYNSSYGYLDITFLFFKGKTVDTFPSGVKAFEFWEAQAKCSQILKTFENTKTQHGYKYLSKNVNIRRNKLYKQVTTMFKDSLTSNWIYIHKKA